MMCAVVVAGLAASPLLGDRDGQALGHEGDAASVAMVHSAQSALGAPTQASPAQATLQLQALIGQHSVLAADMMRARLRGDPDFAQAANAALSKNTEAMAQLVGSLFGKDAQAQFATLWATHITALFNYARGLADRDLSVRNEARSALLQYERNLAEFFAKASKGRLEQAAAESGLRTHVDRLLQQADAYAARDYVRAARLYREAYTHSFGLGTALATGLLGPSSTAALQSPQWRLQSQLGRLLGEHVSLVVAAIRAGTAGGDDFRAAGQALDGNTRDLTGAVASLFGANAAQRFQSLWADHIDQVVSYAAAAGRDDARRADALAKLDLFQRQLASFLESATSKRLPSPALAQALLMHDQMLVRAVDALTAKDYQQANDITYSAYQQMFQMAGQLAKAFGATIASRLPKGGAQTGGGGMAAVVRRR